MKNIIKEFKTFALRGNVMDLAIGVVIGTAFGKIVTSLVDDIIMPLIGLMGKTNFSHWTIFGRVRIGMFVNNVINLMIVAISIFVVIKFLNRITRRKIADTEPKV